VGKRREAWTLGCLDPAEHRLPELACPSSAATHKVSKPYSRWPPAAIRDAGPEIKIGIGGKLKVAIVLIAIAALAIALPAATSARSAGAEATYSHFRVWDAGSQIKWAITICSGYRTQIRRFSATLVPESMGVPYTRLWSGGSTGPGCVRWTLAAADVWTEQVWYSRLTIVLGNGQLLRTGYRAFYIS
jgi:hypothetical protein